MKPMNDYTGFGLEAGVKVFLDMLQAQGDTPLSEVGVEKARADQLEALKANSIKTLPADIEDMMIDAGLDEKVSIRIVRPPKLEGKLPVVMYFHGGGWVLSDQNTHDRVIREIAHGAGAAIVFVNYSRSPEVQYPVANEQAYAATQWIANNGQRIGLDPTRIAVAGDSVGGNMAAVVSLMAKAKSGPKIALQIMLYPVVDVAFDTPSYQQFANGFMLSRETMQWFLDQYAPDKSVREHITISPLKASTETLKDLPPALIITAEYDVLRDEAEAFAHKLSDSGVPVTATRYLGTIHGFATMNALMHTKGAKAAIAQSCAALSEVFKL